MAHNDGLEGRGFRRVSARVSEGFPRGFRGFPGVSGGFREVDASTALWENEVLRLPDSDKIRVS